jgi:hypothetical protein
MRVYRIQNVVGKISPNRITGSLEVYKQYSVLRTIREVLSFYVGGV